LKTCQLRIGKIFSHYGYLLCEDQLLRIPRANNTDVAWFSELNPKDQLALDDISISIQAGEKAAIIGRTGR
jgi:ABC-type multidrug transport system fused ATPase/permease subunit